MKLLVASKNRKKGEELRRILSDMDVELLTLEDLPDAPDVEEDGATFEENAAKKALSYARWSGMAAVADDSGLCVDALGGRPGVLSARYADGDTSEQALCGKLLDELERSGGTERSASFHCSIAFAEPQTVVFVVEGRCEGRITDEMRGDKGFGYDPVFFYESLGRTFAQLSADEKDRVSHRARALEKFKARFREYLSGRTGAA